MGVQIIENPTAFLASLGGLHDVEVEAAQIDVVSQILKLVVVDLYANFGNPDLPEYPGCRSATLVFHDATDLFVDLNIDEGLRISRATIVPEPPLYRLEIDLNIGYGTGTDSRPKITATFKSLINDLGPCEGRDPSNNPQSD